MSITSSSSLSCSCIVVVVAVVAVGVAEFSDHGLQSTDECSQRGPGRS